MKKKMMKKKLVNYKINYKIRINILNSNIFPSEYYKIKKK